MNVRDIPPKVVVPEDKVVEATSGSGTVVNFSAHATDEKDGTEQVFCAPSSGSVFPIKSINV